MQQHLRPGLAPRAGMGLASCDLTILRAVFDTLANHYPERMGQLWMYDAPLVFWGLWKVRVPAVSGTSQLECLARLLA